MNKYHGVSRSMFLAGVVSLGAAISASNVSAITIEFDYSYDTNGFYTPERQALMNIAASFYSGFSDQLTVIAPKADDTWSVRINPSLFSVTLTDVSIAANTIKIYAGASFSGPGVLGMAGTGTRLTASGSSDFEDSVLSRGQLNTTGSDASDYGVWGGSIWINTNNSWYFGEAEAGLMPGHPDFLTTITHEIGHILGIGEADSWFSQIDDDGFFSGVASVAEHGSVVELGSFGSHWAEGTMSFRDGIAQETMMDPSTPAGIRQLPTALDYAGFEDIGWQVTPVPVPASLWLFASGLGLLLVRLKGRKS